MKKKYISIVLFLVMVASSLDVAYAALGGSEEDGRDYVSSKALVNLPYEGVLDEQDLSISKEALLSGNTEVKYFDDITSKEAVDYIRTQLLKHISEISIQFPSKGDVDEQLIIGLLSAAINECGPETGDYLQFSIGSSGYTFAEADEDGRVITDVTYQISFFTTAEQEEQVDQKIAEIAQKLRLDKRADDYERVYAIYKYITSHVEYDYENLSDDNYTLKYTAYAALFNGKAVCQGYAALFHRLANECGLSSRIISGKTSDGENHAWNIVRIGERYYNVDCTWDAGNNGYGGHEYFLKCDASFTDHIRGVDYASEEFYAKYPMAQADHEYISLPNYEDYDANKILVGGDVVAAIEDGVVTLSGSGATWDYSYVESCDEPPFKDMGITAVVVNEGITELGSELFDSCTEIKTVQLPKSLKIIGFACFAQCTSLTAINIPEGVETIGMFAFQECKSLTKMKLPESITEIGSSAFAQCESLTSLNIPEKITRIESNFVDDCSKLTQIIIPEGVTFIDFTAFAGTGITSIKLPDGIESIEESTFSDCGELRSIELPNKLKSIGSGAFWCCYNLGTVEIPKSVEVIADDAFIACRELKICGEPGSVAEAYAKSQGIPFITPDMREEDQQGGDEQKPDGQTPDNQPEDQQGGDEQKPDGQTPDNQPEDQQGGDEQKPDGQTPDNQPEDQQGGDEQKPDGQTPADPTHQHKYSAWTVTKVATEISAGKKTRTCSVCGDKETKNLAKLKPTLKAVKILKPKAAKKSVTVKWKKVSKAKLKKIKKIEIQYTTDKNFGKNVRSKKVSTKKSSYKLTKLKAKKRYYVRIRAYTKSGGKVHVSKWSSVMKVKTK